MKKSNIASFIAGAMIFGSVGVFAGQYTATENPFPIQFNGSNVSMEGYNINDSTYFKLRDIADTVGGFSVDFQNNTIQLSNDGYVYSSKAEPEYNDYAEFERLFSEQEYILEDNLSMYLDSGTQDTVGMVNSINQSKDALLQKVFDLANSYLNKYDTSYEISMEEVNNLCQNRYTEIIAENESNDPDFWTGGTIDSLTSADCLWDAAKDILKQYYYELYKYTGKVEITLTVG